MIWLLFLLAQNAAAEDLVADGEKIFARNCSTGYCHGLAGAAGSGPRLRGRRLDRDYVYQVILNGITDSGMPGWKDHLSGEDISAVLAYVMSLSSTREPPPEAVPMPSGVGPATFRKLQVPLQVRAGYELFFDAIRIRRCGTCHSLAGQGISIGPDLTKLASKENGELLSLIRGNHSKHVLTATLKNGGVFPVLRVEQTEAQVRVYDLSSPLPVLRTLGRSEIQSLVQANDWPHRSVVTSYNHQELKAILLYLNWLTAQKSE